MLIGIPVTLAAVGLFIKEAKLSQDAGIFVLLGLIGATIFWGLVGGLLARLILRSKVRFFRSYDHQ